MNQFIFGMSPRRIDSALMDTSSLLRRVGQNTGNLAFAYAIDKHLGPDLPVVGWWDSEERILSAGDHAVLPCANHLGPHSNFEALIQKFRALPIKMTAIGLGAQGTLEGGINDVGLGTIEWLREIIGKSDGCVNVSVRGDFTRSVLAGYGLADSVVVLGCPTLFLNPTPDLGASIYRRFERPKKIAVTAGHHEWTHLAKIEASLAAMVKSSCGGYVAQSPAQMIHLARGEFDLISDSDLIACRDYISPEMSVEEFVSWIRFAGNVFFDVPAWMEFYRKFDFVVGTRIHGVMLALQAGIPAMCVAHDSRTLELCQTMKIPHVRHLDVASGLSRDDLNRLFDFDPSAFDENRKLLAHRYSNFLRSNGLRSSEWLDPLLS